MARLRKYRTDLIIVAGFVLLPLLLYWEVSVGGRTMLPVDNLFQWLPWASAASRFEAEIPQNGLITDLIIENYAWKRFILKSVQLGEIPLWNPYLFAGAPFLATGQHSAYYPFSILFLVLPLSKAYGWFAVSQLWLAGALMYFFGLAVGMRRAGAALAGLIYQGAGFMVVSAAVFPMILGAAVWLPLLLACIERIIRRASSTSTLPAGHPLPWMVLGAAGLGAQILAGHVEITYYTLLIMALFAIWRLASLLRRQKSVAVLTKPAAWLVASVALGIMLGAVQLIPLVEVGQRNFREDAASFAEVRSWAFPARRLVTLAVPNFYGNPTHHSYADVISGEQVAFDTNYFGELNPRGPYSSDWGIKNYVEGGVYLGILPLFLAAIGFTAVWQRSSDGQRRSHVAFLTLLSLVSLAFIFGTPLYAILYYGLPFVNQLHTPFRWVFPFSLSVAALAGFGADVLARTGPRTGSWARRQEPLALPQEAPRPLTWASDRDGTGWLRPLVLWGKPTIVTMTAGLSFYGGLLLLAALFASRLVYRELEPTISRLFLALSQAADAFPTARAFYSYEFRQIFVLALMLIAAGAVLRVSRCPLFIRGRPVWLFLAATTILVDLVVANYGFNARAEPELLQYEPQLVSWLREQPGLWRLTSFNPRGDKPLNANAAWLFDLHDVRGYDSIIPKQYTAYMATIEPQNELQFNRVQPIANLESLNSPLLDVLGVRYIVTAESVELPKLRLAWEGEGLRVYENLAAAPRAFSLPFASTVIVDDALVALTEFDPRQYVVVEKADLTSGVGTGSIVEAATAGINQPARIDAYGNIELKVSTRVTEPSWLILNDSYFPGWKAFVRHTNGEAGQEREVDIIRVNGNFRGVILEPGEWTVRFRYSPRSFQLGALTSFMGGIFLLFAVGAWGWRRLVGPETVLTTTRSIAKNSFIPVMMNLFNRLIDFAFAAFYLRVLGPADAGSYATAIATAGVFEILSNYGLDILLMREVSQDKSKATHYLLNTSLLRLGAAVVASLPIVLLLVGTSFVANPPSSVEITAIALIMGGMLFSGLSKGVDRLFYVYERAEIPAVMTTVTTCLKVLFGVVALLLGFGFVGLAAVSILTNVITLAILAFLARRHIALPGPWRVDWQLQSQMVRLGFPLMLIHLLQTVFISVDVFLLRFMLSNGEEVVGWYNSAYKWFNALQIIPSFFTLALFPIISREIKEAPESARRMYRLALKLMLLLALPTAAVTSLVAFPLVSVLAGSEFLPHGARALQIVIWSIPLGWLNSVTNYVLIGLGLEKKQPRAFALAVGFNIVSNIILIPRFTYVAASVTTILSELVLLILFDYYLRQRLPRESWLRFLWRPLLVTGGMVLVMLLGSRIHLAVGLLTGVVAYAGGLWLMGVVGEEERQVIRSILPASLANRIGAS